MTEHRDTQITKKDLEDATKKVLDKIPYNPVSWFGVLVISVLVNSCQSNDINSELKILRKEQQEMYRLVGELLKSKQDKVKEADTGSKR
jgi:hypothetical protein